MSSHAHHLISHRAGAPAASSALASDIDARTTSNGRVLRRARASVGAGLVGCANYIETSCSMFAQVSKDSVISQEVIKAVIEQTRWLVAVSRTRVDQTK